MKSGLVEKLNRSLMQSPKMRIIGTITFSLTVVFFLCCALANASSGGGEADGGKNWVGFFWRAFNFVVLAGLLYWLLAAKVKDFFVGRQKALKIALEEAAASKEEALRKFAEYDAKLDKAAEEIKSIAEVIRAQGLAEKEKIIAAAVQAAEKMKDDARKRVEQEMKKARNDLRAEVVRISIQMAQEILKKQIAATDHAAMVDEYIDKVVTRN
jgi:F-type H+-transporting ATPase subunit b